MNPPKLNSRRVTVLVSDPANIREYVEVLRKNQFLVEISTEPSKMYAMLCEGAAPGFALISTQMENAMARMMPDFIVKRFSAPVFLFDETKSRPAPQISAAAMAPLIHPLGHPAPEELLKTLETYQIEEGRKWSFSLPGPSSNEPSVTVTEVVREEAHSEGVFSRLREAMELNPIAIQDSDVLTLHACRVKDPDSGGYFVFAFPVRDPHTEPDEALLILESRIRDEAGFGVAIEHLVQAVPGSFFQDLCRKSDEVVSGRVGDCEMILLYFRNRHDVNQPDARIAEESFLVPLEDWWVDLPLPCHTYVWLEKNRRRILYVRPGDRLRPEALSRLRERGVEFLAIDPADFMHYQRIREMVHVARLDQARPAS